MNVAIVEQESVREAGRDLIDVVGDEHSREDVSIASHPSEEPNELFPPAEVEPGCRLIEDPQRGVVHQRPCEQHTLELSRRQRAELYVGELTAPKSIQEAARIRSVGIVVGVPPGREVGIFPRGHDVLDAKGRPEHAGQRGTSEAEATAERAYVRATQPLAQDLDGAMRRVDVQAGQPAQRGLSRSVRPKHDPAVITPHTPVDLVQDGAVAPDQVDPAKGEDGIVVHRAWLPSGF